MAYLQNFKGGEEQKNLQWKAKSTKKQTNEEIKGRKETNFLQR